MKIKPKFTDKEAWALLNRSMGKDHDKGALSRAVTKLMESIVKYDEYMESK